LHFSFHPRSSKRKPGSMEWERQPRDLGSAPIHAHVHVPAALLRPDGPGNPTLEAWGMCASKPGVARARLEDYLIDANTAGSSAADKITAAASTT
jgi:hypothetical protein